MMMTVATTVVEGGGRGDDAAVLAPRAAIEDPGAVDIADDEEEVRGEGAEDDGSGAGAGSIVKFIRKSRTPEDMMQSERVNLMKGFLQQLLRPYTYVTLPIASGDGSVFDVPFQMLACRRKEIVVPTYWTRTAEKMDFKATVQRYEEIFARPGAGLARGEMLIFYSDDPD